MHWLVPWNPSPTVASVTGAAAMLYTLGSLRCPTPWLRQASFWLGLLSMYAVLHTQYDYYAGRMFFAHCLQHIVLHHDGPFFIALSMPGMALAAGLPIHWRQCMAMCLDLPLLKRDINALNHPVVAVCLFCGLNIFWMIPPVHFATMLDARLYRIMNWSMAINGLMFWNLALNDYCLCPARLSPARRIMMMLAIVPPQIIVGLLIFSAPQPLYAAYGLCGHLIPGLSPLADQQIGGFILWVPAVMMSVLGILTVLGREWLRRKAPAELPLSRAGA